MGWGATHEPLLPREELLTVGGFWGREDPFSLRVWPLVSLTSSIRWPHSMRDPECLGNANRNLWVGRPIKQRVDEVGGR